MYMYLEKKIEPLILCHLDSNDSIRNSKVSTRYSKFSSFEDRVELFEFRVTVNFHLTGTVYIMVVGPLCKWSPNRSVIIPVITKI